MICTYYAYGNGGLDRETGQEYLWPVTMHGRGTVKHLVRWVCMQKRSTIIIFYFKIEYNCTHPSHKINA